MRLLADENVPGLLVASLRSHGHDVLWARDRMPSRPDAEVLARAASERRVVVTFDKDFGELAFRSRLPAECGIVLIRMSVPAPLAAEVALLSILEGSPGPTGNFTVLKEGRVRMRSLPPSP